MRDVNHNELVDKLALKLTDTCKAPEWAKSVKTGNGRQRPPTRDDWWQVRSAAVLLSVQSLGPIGVSKLSVKYGNRKNRGNQPEAFARASGSILRKILQQLETAKLVEQTTIGAHKGRITTKAGDKLIVESSKEAKKVN